MLLFGFTPTQYRSYRDFPALLVEEDIWCSFMHYLGTKWSPELLEQQTFCKMKKSKVPEGIQTTVVWGKWYGVKDLNYWTTDTHLII
jgi:hypothetical protein